jgi:hypothetical protein
VFPSSSGTDPKHIEELVVIEIFRQIFDVEIVLPSNLSTLLKLSSASLRRQDERDLACAAMISRCNDLDVHVQQFPRRPKDSVLHDSSVES